MRLLKTNEEAFGMGNLTGGNSLVPTVHELWNTWEIHCLILTSLSLQAFLFMFADIRRRSSSRVLRTVLWLAYLTADSVSIFVLGHLAVHAGQPRHHLMSFWAPFVLVHLGGQDTITAFSRQDNELWKRHLLGLVTQVAVAGYVVAKASWPDVRLRAAVVLIFLSGCFRYAERTVCLYLSSPAKLKSKALSETPQSIVYHVSEEGPFDGGAIVVSVSNIDEIGKTVLDHISRGGGSRGLSLFKQYPHITSDLMSGDVPVNRLEMAYAGVRIDSTTRSDFVLLPDAEDHLQSMLRQFLASPGRCKVYEHVGALLVYVYQTLYTKIPFRMTLYYMYTRDCLHFGWIGCFTIFLLLHPLLLYPLFQIASAPIALGLFWAAEKGHYLDQLHTSPADITVSYILLIGAIALDVSATISTFSNYFQAPAAWYNKKQWSEKLGQYSIINRHVGLPEVTHTPVISKDDDEGSKPSPTKEFILDSLVRFGRRKQWNIASFRGRWAIQKWMNKDGIALSLRQKKVLVETTSDGIMDFPTSVLIWHIATEICYYHQYGSPASTTIPNAQLISKKHKQISRELSNYIMYLLFKCRVMLTTNSQIVHDRAHDGIRKIVAAEKKRDINDFVRKLFDGMKNHQQKLHQELARSRDNNSAATAGNHPLQEFFEVEGVPSTSTSASLLRKNNPLQKFLRSARFLLPRASELAQELIGISDETERWELMASVWAEMLYYTAPRCGAAFHYERLSTGGEFVTHLLVLMHVYTWSFPSRP